MRLRRSEALVTLAVAVLMFTAGATWLAGAWALLVLGALLALASVLIDVDDGEE